ncbi:MAG: exodeoxyribonuclease VII large subunit [Kofleriaceae bacterium]|nr:exodeoxyribonuclease VII large subunit [Kofleriaceae bacterium]MBP6840211.1 exodeoxyribonuclease VII large subunit [Kofleriaceae bacterium]
MAGPDGDQAERPTRERPWSLGLLIRRASASLDDGVGLVWVEAEVVRASRPKSGHVYLELRDQAAAVPAVVWASHAARLRVAFEPGQRLRLRGRLGIYDRDGKLQLYVDFAEPAGLGDAARALEELKRALAAEGLFAPGRKRALPRFPRRIGVVTSRTGAAVRDIVQTVQRRFPTPILLADCVVQGPTAPREIVAALARIVRPDLGVDVIILGRGGGSAGDLAAFNDERVVRAVAACPVPVISAVGHEVDLALSDLVADCRASTPTAAAELAVPARAELAEALRATQTRLARELGLYVTRARQDLDRDGDRLEHQVRRRLAAGRAELHALERRRDDQHPLARLVARRRELAALTRALDAHHPGRALAQRRQVLTQLEQRLVAAGPPRRVATHRAELAALRARLHAAARARVGRGRQGLAEAGAGLHALSPLAVLDRGYAVVRAGDRVVRAPADASPGTALTIRVAGGTLSARVTDDHGEGAS